MEIRGSCLFDLSENLLAMTGVLTTLLYDHTTNKNIIWMTSQYSELGVGYGETDEIDENHISGENRNVVKPRINKPLEEQEYRSRKRGEVFTPSWVCNIQNNQIDGSWFVPDYSFNRETKDGWEVQTSALQFLPGKTWQAYVMDRRLEITCGEAPYLTSRYDTVTGDFIPVLSRIGLLDRKLRVVTENCGTPREWKEWATEALKSIYGYDWQGDNVLLSRENMLCSIAEAYKASFSIPPSRSDVLSWADIISWNIWQMDGIRCVIPESCVDYKIVDTLLGPQRISCKCQGCTNNAVFDHNGTYCVVMDWQENQTIRFVDIMRR